MFNWRNMMVAVTTLALGCLSGTTALTATAATPACGPHCLSVFSDELGSYKHLGVVEDVLDGVARIGQPSVLNPGSGADPSEDFLPVAKPVAAFYKDGMVSAQINSHYGQLKASQIEYAPEGKPTGLCVGLATTPYQNEGLTMQPCNTPGRTVWIIDTSDSPSTAHAGFFPIVSAATTDLVHPFAMTLPDYEVTYHQPLQIHVSKLVFSGSTKTLASRQLWGVHFGPLPVAE
jgi:hypothetical protein